MPALGIFFASVFFLIWDASRCLMFDVRMSDAIGNLTVSLVVLIFILYVSHSRSIIEKGKSVSSFIIPRFLVPVTRISKEFYSTLNSRQLHPPQRSPRAGKGTRVGAFQKVFRDLQDVHSLAPLPSQQLSKISSNAW